jgi:hypothetical protein
MCSGITNEEEVTCNYTKGSEQPKHRSLVSAKGLQEKYYLIGV